MLHGYDTYPGLITGRPPVSQPPCSPLLVFCGEAGVRSLLSLLFPPLKFSQQTGCRSPCRSLSRLPAAAASPTVVLTCLHLCLPTLALPVAAVASETSGGGWSLKARGRHSPRESWTVVEASAGLFLLWVVASLLGRSCYRSRARFCRTKT